MTTSQQHHDIEAGGFSPKFAVTFKATKDLLFYANATKGFQFGGVSLYQSSDPRYETPSSFKSSKLWSYELGSRTDWFHRTLRADLTVFYIDWKDPQIVQDAPGANIYQYVDNVGAATSKGVEAALRWLTPLPGLSVNTVGSYIVAKTTVPYTDAENNMIASGTDMPQSPRVQASAVLNYAGRFGGWVAGPSLAYAYQGTAWNKINHQKKIFGYGMLNASLDISRPDWRFAPALNFGVSNLTNVLAFNSYGEGSTVSADCPVKLPDPLGCTLESPAGGVITAQSHHIATNYTRPRTFSARLSFSF
jgi:outer membrane receptor protein involved in Fe transport